MHLRLLVIHGLMLSGLFGLVAVVSLLADPMIWLDNYPPDIRAAIGDSVEPPVVAKTITAIALVAAVIGGLVLSVRRLDRESGGVGFRGVALHVFLLFWVVNAFDVVVLDWLLFMNVLRPWVILPGTEGMAGYDDYLFHLRGSFAALTPWIGSLILSVGFGAGWWSLVARRRS